MIRAALLALLLASAAEAQIATDGTAGARVRLDGPEMRIRPGLGTRAGENLLHSFSRFDVATGRVAAFGVPEGVERVIGRVTGPAASNIDGIVSFVDVNFAPVAAEFVFFNPMGLVIGPNAQFRTSGTLRLAAADSVLFENGARLVARPDAPLRLISARPEAFGFLGPGGALRLDGARLPAQGDGITLAGGEVALDGALLLSERGGDLTLFAGAAGDVAPFEGGGRSGGGAVRILGGSSATTFASDAPGGAIRISAGRLEIDGSELGTISFRGAPAEAPAGDVSIRAREIAITAGGAIRSQAQGAGAAGAIRVTGFQTMLIDRAGTLLETVVESEVSDGAAGDAGLVLVRGGELRLEDGGNIFSSTLGLGDAGEVRVEVDRLAAAGGGQIGSGAFRVPGRPGVARGAGGRVTVTARKSMSFSGVRRETANADEPEPSGLFTGTEGERSGPGGDLVVSAPLILLSDEAEMGAETFNASPAGAVRISGGTLLLEGGAEITTTARQSGAAGTVSISMRDQVELSGGSEIASRSLAGPAAAGSAGAVTVNAGRVIVRPGARITTSSNAVDGGAIRITGRDYALINSGVVTTSVGASDGDGGAIDVRGGLLALNDRALLESTARRGDGGTVRIATPVTLIEPPDASIDVSSDLGQAGVVQILGAVNSLTTEAEAPPAEFFDRFALIDDFCVAAVTGGSALRLAPPEGSAETAAPALFGAAAPYPVAAASGAAAPTRAQLGRAPSRAPGCDPAR